MKLATLLFSILISITFVYGQDTDKASKCGKTESVESVEKNCNKQINSKHKCAESKECTKDASCKHKCDKDSDKYEKGKMCKHKSECKNNKVKEHKCGDGKCGEGKCGGGAVDE